MSAERDRCAAKDGGRRCILPAHHEASMNPTPHDFGLSAAADPAANRLADDLLKQFTDRPPSADVLEAHRIELLQRQIERERALAGLFETLHVLALEVRAHLSAEAGKRR